MNLTDDEIRVKCAEAKGYRMVEFPYAFPSVEMMKKRLIPEVFEQLVCYAYEVIPDYPASVDAALTLCDRLREEGWSSFIEHHGKGPWSVTFTKPFERDKCASDPSLARAICLAFLKVKGEAK